MLKDFTSAERGFIAVGYTDLRKGIDGLAVLVQQKFVMASLLYRKEQEWKRAGVQLSRQTMSNWVLTAAGDRLTPVYTELHKKLLTHDILHADETTFDRAV